MICRPVRGEDHYRSVLTDADVHNIRAWYRQGHKKQEIADALGCGRTAIHYVLAGRTWSHVPDPLGPIVMRRRSVGLAPLPVRQPVESEPEPGPMELAELAQRIALARRHKRERCGLDVTAADFEPVSVCSENSRVVN